MDRKKYAIKHKHFLVLFLIASVCVTVYFPSLFHVSRSDQDNFFIETADINSLPALIGNTYSYNRWRMFDQGDEVSFKPLYFTFLSFGKWLYGYNYFLWQLTGLCLHILLVWQLFRILNLIFPHILSVFISLHFAVVFLIQDMVTWQHMNPCIILYIFLLKAFEYCLKYISSRQEESRYFWKIFIYTSLICFIRETGVMYAFLIMVALYIHRTFILQKTLRAKDELMNTAKRINIGILSAPIVVYLIWNVADYMARGQEGGVVVKAPGVFGFLQFVFISLVYPFCPAFLKFQLPQFPQQRVVAESFHWRDLAANYIPNHVLSNLNLLLLALIVGMILMILYAALMVKKRSSAGRAAFDKEENAGRVTSSIFLGSICFFCWALYCVIIYWTRFAAYGMLALKFNTYYFYPLVLFSILIMYTKFAFFSIYMRQREIQRFTALCIAILSLSVVLNGYYNYSFNVALKEHGQPILAERRAVGLDSYYLAKKYNGRGVLRYRKKLNESALEDLKKARMFDPNNVHVDYNMGLVYMATKEPLRAASHFTRAIELNPRDPKMYVHRGGAYQKSDKTRLALADFNQAIQIDPNYVGAYVYRSLTFYSTRDVNRALADALKAESLGHQWAQGYVEHLRSKVNTFTQ